MATTLRGTQAPMASRVAGTTMPRSRPTALLGAAVTVLRTQPTTHLAAVAASVAEAPVAAAAVTHARRTRGYGRGRGFRRGMQGFGPTLLQWIGLGAVMRIVGVAAAVQELRHSVASVDWL